MHRTTRLIGILIALQAGPKTAAQLADRFEVSRRTILRDIEELALVDVPIEARPGAGGGYTLPPKWRFAPANLTATEVETLLMALAHLGHGAGTAIPGADDLAEKLRAALHPEVMARVDADPTRPSVHADLVHPDPAVLATLRTALERGDWLEFAYAGGSHDQPRLVLPVTTYVHGGRWYLTAIDATRRAHRHFRIDRITGARRRLPPPDASAIIAGAEARPDYAASTNPEVVLRLTDRGRQWCLDHPDFRPHVTDHEARFRCPPEELPYYLREVLRFGREVTLLGPPEAIDLLQGMLRDLLDHHRAGDS